MAGLVAKAGEVDNGYKIEKWDFVATVHENNIWDVTETMTVNYLEERHGIYRFIPRKYLRYHEGNGGSEKYTYKTKISHVTVEGYEFTESDADDSQDNLIIRIGSEDVMLSGEHTYVIQYQLRYPDDRYTSGDELFHTILGPECNTEIGKFTFRLNFEKELPGNLNMHTFSGEWGKEGNKLGVTPKQRGKTIAGVAYDIAPFNGITLAAELPEGYWVETDKASSLPFYVSFALFCGLLTLALTYLIFHRRKRPITVIEYSAPGGISSAEVGVIIDNTADLSDLTSLVVWFASKGYLKIREIKDGKEDDIELIVLKPLPDDAPKYQKKFWEAIFGKKSQQKRLSKLGDRHKQIGSAMLALSRQFRGERKLTKIHVPSLLATIGAILAGVCAIGTSGSVCYSQGGEFGFAILLWALPIAVVMLLRLALSNYDMIKGWGWRMWQVLVIVALGAVSLWLFWLFFYEEHDYLVSLSTLAIVIGGGWVLALLSGRIDRDTEYRLQQMSLLLGFKEFIQKAELPMLKAQIDENPSYFYDVLPYAMVFGLTKKWVKKFNEIDMPQPEWYETDGTQLLSSRLVADKLTSQVSSSISKAIEVSSHDLTSAGSGSSSSSGFSGGFSGGGGGGGGVGSW